MLMMGKKFYVYVDGESHYIRNEGKAKKLDGFTTLGKVQRVGNSQGQDVKVRDDCHFFWDSEYLNNLHPDRKVYFTAFTGNDNVLHDAHVYLRSLHFEPYIIKEDKGLRDRRRSKANDAGVIEKPKGADIALAVRMIEDAVLDNYQIVGLFTSDADYLPVIKAVRRMGKYVVVYGFKENLGNPELEYVPDEFVDLGSYWKRTCYKIIA
ncbi:NYN domain protein [Gemmata obscuriglobus]|nr:NYN domain-containing protein [Gemmata obscuriglobus]QEG27072.1 NYN domain protein [Gemmata obscuriglobus]VTS03509.1 Hypothetical cytosolic protein OS=Syntrophus aciditrophicus (strain SB) GN=SYN_03101 PE=4 SV=1: NYN [Gemmata obscuriglobus UQM 2246]